MKTVYLAAIFALITLNICHAQDKENNPLTDSVKARHFIFSAQTMVPSIAGSNNLTGGYDLRISQNKIICYLPYAGKAYSSSYGETKGPLDFTSEKFSYTATQGDKGKWEVVIKPSDTNDVREMDMDIYDNGTAYLNVNFNNRQPVSFNGFIAEAKK